MIQAIQTEWDHLLGIASSSVPAPNHTLHSRIVLVGFRQFQLHMDLCVSSRISLQLARRASEG